MSIIDTMCKAVLGPSRLRGDVEGLYGRMDGDLQRLVRKIADAPNYDLAAMELLDALGALWRPK